MTTREHDPDDLTVIGIDPGETTGVAIITVPRASIYNGQPGSISQHWPFEVSGSITGQVIAICAKAREIGGLNGPYPAIQCEGFRLRTEVTGPEVLMPVRIEAALRFAVETGRASDSLMPPCQLPGSAKGTITDERLKLWGLWTPGSDHKRDATRQAILLIRRAKTDPAVRMQAWGR